MKALDLQTLPASRSDIENARAMSAYMKNHFSFFGIKSQPRRDLLRSFIHANPAPESNTELKAFVLNCWSYPQREMHYCGLEVLIRSHRLWSADDLDFIENLVVGQC